jgi:hypothetical protein
MKANTKARTKFGESRSMNHSISQIQIIVRANNKIWETGNILIAFVQFHMSFLSFIFFGGIDKKRS